MRCSAEYPWGKAGGGGKPIGEGWGRSQAGCGVRSVPGSDLEDAVMQHRLYGRCLPETKWLAIWILSHEVTGYSSRKAAHSSGPFSGKQGMCEFSNQCHTARSRASEGIRIAAWHLRLRFWASLSAPWWMCVSVGPRDSALCLFIYLMVFKLSHPSHTPPTFISSACLHFRLKLDSNYKK